MIGVRSDDTAPVVGSTTTPWLQRVTETTFCGSTEKRYHSIPRDNNASLGFRARLCAANRAHCWSPLESAMIRTNEATSASPGLHRELSEGALSNRVLTERDVPIKNRSRRARCRCKYISNTENITLFNIWLKLYPSAAVTQQICARPTPLNTMQHPRCP